MAATKFICSKCHHAIPLVDQEAHEDVDCDKPKRKSILKDSQYYSLFLAEVNVMISAEAMVKHSRVQMTHQPKITAGLERKYQHARKITISRLGALRDSDFDYTAMKSYEDIKGILKDHSIFSY